MAKDLFNRYIWLVDTIYRAGKITFEEINERWTRNEMSEGKEIPLRTFHNHRVAIEEMFDINIDCDKRNGYVYYIQNKDDMERGGVRTWLLNTFAVNNLINESHKLKHRILFEQIPSGQRFLTPIIEAMRDSLSIEMTYQGFWHDEPYTCIIEPHCVKIFKQRWYVIAKSIQHNAIRIFSLDRVQNTRVTDIPFKLPAGFNPEARFKDNFGIIVDDDIEPCRVEIRAYGNQCKYLQTLPLHHSQEEIETMETHSVFSYFLSPTFDFRQEILSHGEEIEVLSPRWFRDEIQNIVREMNKLYKK
jgi:predicted DNA-binding transcriptional regulator YafY